MENKKIIQLVESFILLPIITISIPFGSLPNNNADIFITPQIVLSQKENIEAYSLLAFNQVSDEKAKEEKEAELRQLKADAIDAYFESKDMPLLGYGMKMVLVAEANDIDWRLLPAISVIETTGGKHMCKNKKAPNNPFGWGSCKFGFTSLDKAIETVGKNLGGNNPNTAHHYGDKNTKEILEKYNPPSIVPDYASKVIKVMHKIGIEDMTLENNIDNKKA